MFLAGDIGGTKTVLALYDTEDVTNPVREETFANHNFKSLPAIVEQFLAEATAVPQTACFGVAGPVRDRQANLTNLPWHISAPDIEDRFGWPVRLLNDLQAIAYAVPNLTGDDLLTLNEAQADPTGPIAVIAPGTGLGEAFLTWNGRSYQPSASEGGHASFGPTTPLQIELLAYLQPRLGHISYERVCSGVGIPNIYSFLREAGHYEEPDWLRQELDAADDKTPIIVNTAVAQRAAICEAVLNLFVEILGSEAGNLALQFMASGGVYVGGGIPPRIVDHLQNGRFMHRFTDKPPHQNLLRDTAVHVIRNPKAALYGAAYAALESIHNIA
jgi:glucokinase